MIRIAKPKPRRALTTTVDLKTVIFDGDRDMRDALLKSKALAPLWKEVEEAGAATKTDSSRHNLLKTAVRLTPGIAPGFFKCVEHCRQVLGLDAQIDVFCVQDPQANAFVIPVRDNRITMGFTSAALQTLNDGEIASVIGHELGHALFEHHTMMGLLGMQGDDRLAPVDAMRFYAWMRYAELSADRVGLLCCDDFDTAISAEFKLASGLSDPRIIGNVKEAAQQYAALKAEAIEHDLEDWLSTHPYSPLRIRALDLFSQSETYHQLRGRPGGTLSEKDLEREVATVMDLMNPAFMSEKTTCKREIKEFMVYGGIDIAVADNKVKRSEIEAIKRLVGGEGKLADSVTDIVELTPEQRAEKIVALSQVLNIQLPLMRRRKVIEDMTAIALADKKVDESEVAALYALADVLGVEQFFVDQALARPGAAID